MAHKKNITDIAELLQCVTLLDPPAEYAGMAVQPVHGG